MEIITPAALSALLLEGIKWLIRWLKKVPGYEFPVNFYLFMLPVLNILLVPVMVLLGVPGVSLPTNWLQWVQGVGYAAVASAISVFIYNGGIRPLKDYRAAQKMEKTVSTKRGKLPLDK